MIKMVDHRRVLLVVAAAVVPFPLVDQFWVRRLRFDR
jgi:hypothetical protein